MNREEALRATRELGASPAAKWVGNKLSDDGARLIQQCTRCGAEEELALPAAAVVAFQGGARGSALASSMPLGFDEKLFGWKKAFQLAHEGCGEDEAPA